MFIRLSLLLSCSVWMKCVYSWKKCMLGISSSLSHKWQWDMLSEKVSVFIVKGQIGLRV